MHPATPEQVCEPAEVTIPHGGRVWLGVGAGFEAYGPALRQRLGDALNRVEPAHRYPRARDALQLGRAVLEAGEGVDAVRALPVYLRDEVTDRGRR